MSSKHRRERQRHSDDSQTRWSGVLTATVLAGAVALVIISTLIPSESAVADGSFAPLAAGWCVLLVVWGVALWSDNQASLRLGWTELAGGLFVGWHSLAAFVALGSVNGRQALNVQWLVIGYGLAAFLVRQTLRTAAQVRALVIVMIWLATLLASLGFYQYFYSLPNLRRQYAANPEQALIENGIPIDRESHERELFENRVHSVEPIATFALANSLAGFLAPWLIAALAVAAANFSNGQKRRTLIAAILIVIALSACLILTKSRTAFLAALAGILLLVIYGRRGGWKLDWRIPAIAAGLLIALGLAATYFGGLDAKVLSEAPKSVLYRLEYWQATAGVIAEFPFFGCGPGNFQEAYTHYKLPQASETVGDPHNFLLEIWATAGTPAVALLLLLMIAVAVDHSTASALATLRVPSRAPGTDASAAIDRRIPFFGALAGILLAAPLANLLGYPLDSLAALPVAWLLGIPLLVSCWWLLEPWVRLGQLTLAALIIPLVVLLINLLAAGAFVFPGVVGTVLVLMPAALCLAEFRSSLPSLTAQPQPSRRRLPMLPRGVPVAHRAAIAVIFLSLLLTVACLRTEYQPVLRGRSQYAEALEALTRRDPARAHAAALAAADADALWPAPWFMLSEMLFQQSLASGKDDDWQAFAAATDTFCRLNPRHHAAWYNRGNWFLTAWRKRSRKEDLDEATNAYRQAIVCYPNRALYHAQLAWVLHLTGENEAAAGESSTAKRLDDLMPHREQKLARQRIADPQFTDADTTMFHADSAELIVDRLRNTDERGMRDPDRVEGSEKEKSS